LANSQTITVVFTDMVGSTALSSSLTPEAADAARQGHFSVLRQALAAHEGREVKNLGDGIMAVFSSPSAAIACAVAMQQAVEQDNRSSANPHGLRVALSGGEVTTEEGDFFGDPVVEAARLCGICEGGQILAAEMVRDMAGRRNRHQSRSVGDLTLKGMPDPLPAVEVLWEPLGEVDTSTPVPLPGRLAVRPGPGVVGRDTELAEIADAVKRVSNGEGREIVLVSGEAGLGKTTLVAESSRSAFDSGSIVLFGHCEEDLATPYELFAEALGYYVTHAPGEQLLAHVSAQGSELARIVPALSSRIPDLPPSRATDADTERFLLFAAVVGLLAMVSEQQPVVLVLDDLQWADKGSLLLLRHLAASDQPMRVLTVGTYRDTELSHGHPFLDTLAALHRQTGVSHIELAGLDDSGVLTLMEAAGGHTLEEDGVNLAHAVYRETDGNPFFVIEVLRHLAETGAIYQDDSGRWVAGTDLDQMALPESVRVVIGSRVGRLGPEATKVLSTAAIIGKDFDLDVLAQATSTSEDELLDILEAASAVALVREPANTSGRYSFTHALIQHTLSEDLGATRRARAHRQIAEAMEHLYGDHPGARVSELARHWLTATQPIDITKAVGYACQAGDAALAALAPADALGYFAQALDLYPQATDPDPALAIDLAIGLGTAQRLTGDPAHRETLLDAARRAASLGDTERLVAAALANNRGKFSMLGTTDSDKVEVLEQALDRLPANHPDRALVLATLCAEVNLSASLERREALTEEALVIAEASRDDTVMARVLNFVANGSPPALHEQLLTRTTEGLVRAQRVGDPGLLFWAAVNRAFAAHMGGDINEWDRDLQIQLSAAERLDQPLFWWQYTAYQASRALLAGDTDRAEKLAAEALQIGTDAGQADAALWFGPQLIGISTQRGTLGDLVPLIEQMVADAPDVAGVLTAALGLAYAETDRTEDARQLLVTFAESRFTLPQNLNWLPGMVLYAEVAIAVRDPAYAAPIFEHLAPFADQVATTGLTSTGLVSRYLGGLAVVMGRYDEADAYYARAAALCTQMGAEYLAARTDLYRGKMYGERNRPGDAAEARALLAKAHAAAVAHGYGNLERRSAAALQALGD
jgi:class 3 adenylate cyclase/tetratricopeptide (TPR) repeat protein